MRKKVKIDNNNNNNNNFTQLISSNMKFFKAHFSKSNSIAVITLCTVKDYVFEPNLFPGIDNNRSRRIFSPLFVR